MRKIVTLIVLSTALATGAYHGLKDVCRPVCDINLWQSKVILEKVYVDFNQDGYFDKSELRTNYSVARQEMALITFKDYGSRYLWIYPPGNKQPKYQIKSRDLGLGKFTRLYLPDELLDCCFVEKGASRRNNEKQKPGNNPKLQKTLIRMDQIQQANLNGSNELEIVTNSLGTFVLQKDRARLEKGRIRQYQLCNC